MVFGPQLLPFKKRPFLKQKEKYIWYKAHVPDNWSVHDYIMPLKIGLTTCKWKLILNLDKINITMISFF